MIKEIFSYLLNFSRPMSNRRFGYLYESIALNAREKRCHQHWQAHHQQSKDIILKTVRKIKNKKYILILGPGPMHEIPIDELARQFARVDLVDIIHLKETKKKYQHLKNIHFITADLTELQQKIFKEKKMINQIPSLFLNNEYSLVISANLLSQLSLPLKNFLQKKALTPLSSLELDFFSKQVGEDHISYLKKFNCPVLLITDIKTHYLSLKNEPLLVETIPSFNSLPPPLVEWWWDLAPISEISLDYSVKMKVAAFHLNF